jgi:hypothetical protein
MLCFAIEDLIVISRDEAIDEMMKLINSVPVSEHLQLAQHMLAMINECIGNGRMYNDITNAAYGAVDNCDEDD